MQPISFFLSLAAIVFSTAAHALDLEADFLYWQPSETIDWAFTNNTGYPNQKVAFQTIGFHATPGYRLSLGYHRQAWGIKGIVTDYKTNSNSSLEGNVTSAFMGGKLAEVLYQAGQVHFGIEFTMLEADWYKNFYPENNLRITPLIGLQGGKINQSVRTQFQGQHQIVEEVHNNFSGIGPKAGVEGEWTLIQRNNYSFGITALGATSYQWGRWHINDVLRQTQTPRQIITEVGPRDVGAFSLQSQLGLHWTYKKTSILLSYELSDWFNQYQVLDDATGAHNNDLVFQGLTLGITYQMK